MDVAKSIPTYKSSDNKNYSFKKSSPVEHDYYSNPLFRERNLKTDWIFIPGRGVAASLLAGGYVDHRVEKNIKISFPDKNEQ